MRLSIQCWTMFWHHDGCLMLPGLQICYPRLRNFWAWDILAAPLSRECACSWCRGRQMCECKALPSVSGTLSRLGWMYAGLTLNDRFIFMAVVPLWSVWWTRREKRGRAMVKALIVVSGFLAEDCRISFLRLKDNLPELDSQAVLRSVCTAAMQIFGWLGLLPK